MDGKCTCQVVDGSSGLCTDSSSSGSVGNHRKKTQFPVNTTGYFPLSTPVLDRFRKVYKKIPFPFYANMMCICKSEGKVELPCTSKYHFLSTSSIYINFLSVFDIYLLNITVICSQVINFAFVYI